MNEALTAPTAKVVRSEGWTRVGTPVTRAEDVLELYDLAPVRARRPELAPASRALLERLREGALTGDELLRASGLDAQQASAALLELELARAVHLEDGVYRAAI